MPNPKVTVPITQTVTMVANPVDRLENSIALLPADLTIILAPGVTQLQIQTGSSQQVLPGEARIVPLAAGSYPGAVLITATRADLTVATTAVDVEVTVGPFDHFSPTFKPPVNKP